MVSFQDITPSTPDTAGFNPATPVTGTSTRPTPAAASSGRVDGSSGMLTVISTSAGSRQASRAEARTSSIRSIGSPRPGKNPSAIRPARLAAAFD